MLLTRPSSWCSGEGETDGGRVEGKTRGVEHVVDYLLGVRHSPRVVPPVVAGRPVLVLPPLIRGSPPPPAPPEVLHHGFSLSREGSEPALSLGEAFFSAGKSVVLGPGAGNGGQRHAGAGVGTVWCGKHADPSPTSVRRGTVPVRGAPRSGSGNVVVVRVGLIGGVQFHRCCRGVSIEGEWMNSYLSAFGAERKVLAWGLESGSSLGRGTMQWFSVLQCGGPIARAGRCVGCGEGISRVPGLGLGAGARSDPAPV